MPTNENVDNGKHSPTGNYTKASASTTAQWPTCMGAWDAPGQTLVPEDDGYDIEDAIETNADTGTQNYNPVNGRTGG